MISNLINLRVIVKPATESEQLEKDTKEREDPS